MANNFKIIYRILKILRDAMELEEIDRNIISHESLGISYPLWSRLMKMLVENGYIDRITVMRVVGNGTLPGIKVNRHEITLKGLEYLEENSLMRKAADITKGIADTSM